MQLVPMTRLQLQQLYSVVFKLTERFLLCQAALFSPLVAVLLLLSFMVLYLGAFIFVAASALKVNTAVRASDSHPTTQASGPTTPASDPAVPASHSPVAILSHSATPIIWQDWFLSTGFGHPSGPRKDLQRASPPFERFGSRFWALLVANEDYPSHTLSGCRNDAERVARYLEGYLHVPATNVMHLTNARRK